MLSFFIPGVGQIYNGQIGKGIGVIVIQLVNFLLTFVVVGFLTGFLVWLWSIFDAYQEAENYNSDQVVVPAARQSAFTSSDDAGGGGQRVEVTVLWYLTSGAKIKSAVEPLPTTWSCR